MGRAGLIYLLISAVSIVALYLITVFSVLPALVIVLVGVP